MRIGRPRRFENAFNGAIVSMCDIQLFNGLGILVSGFISIKCGLQAYHWQILVYLAWFSSVTHLSCLTVLRRYLGRRPTETYIRYTLMVILLIVLMVAAVPTGFFNWFSVEGETWDWEDGCRRTMDGTTLATAAIQSSPAICFLDIELGRQNYHRAANYSFYVCGQVFKSSENNKQSLGNTAALQAMVVSVVLLALGFISRSVKLFKSMSMTVDRGFRQPVSNLAQRFLTKLAGDPSQPTAQRRRTLVVNPFLAAFLALRLNFDLFSSMLAELYGLLILLLWGTMRLDIARSDVPQEIRGDLTESNQWSFGQILSALLLIAPVWSMAVGFTEDQPSNSPSHDHEHIMLERLGQDSIGTSKLKNDTFSSDVTHRTPTVDFINRDDYQTAPWVASSSTMACATILMYTTALFESVVTI
ncbi:hypothetical protein VMCG_05817 [Cytospora schulzeri]|uniref:Uncharacterized protein n=1 Tax=Cytospora schulzeri TaxID=448051 RepID=A0A423WHY6_9PEZI|nr:hypothetical protein VMCG_05817 [Valsa malicola]